MKKFIIILLLLMEANAYAQHNPLKHINLHSVYIAQSGSEKYYNIGNTRDIYASHFYQGRNRISHHKGIQSPDLGYNLWEISTVIDTDEAIAIELYTTKEETFSGFYTGQTQISILVGSTLYKSPKWHYSETPGHYSLMIDIDQNITKHISISGLQGIYVNGIEIISYSEIEQELWRRAALDVYNMRAEERVRH